MRILVFLILGVAVLAACNRRDDSILFDGVAFRAKADFVDRDDRRDFTVQTSPVSASRAGALEAAIYEGTKYCIENYGTSDILWSADYEAEGAVLPVTNDTLTLSGTCDR